MTNNPPIQIVDDKDSPIGEASIEEAYDKGQIHRVIYIIIEDEKGRILLQKRGPKVINYPNRWDISAAGHVDAGESYEAAAKREAAEELGISGDLELSEAAYFRSDEEHYGRLLHRFNKIYRAVILANTEFKPQPGEVTEVRWFDLQEVKELIAEQPNNVATGLTLSLERGYA